MSEPFIDLDAIFHHALKETQELIELGFDISEPCLVTSLGWYANKYPEIAERCNNDLLDLINKQAAATPNTVRISQIRNPVSSRNRVSPTANYP